MFGLIEDHKLTSIKFALPDHETETDTDEEDDGRE
ncbi:hypothetical protein Asal01_02644 [Fodinibius salicampi]